MTQKLLKGRPADCSGRQERETRVYDFLDALGIEYWRIDHEAASTMEDCEAVDMELDAVLCKNLFLCNRQMTRFYLLMMPADKKFLTKDLSSQIGSARLSFAGQEHMLKYLDILPGSVSVMGLMNDRERAVQLLIDGDVLKSVFVGCHPCVNTSSIRLRAADLLERILPAMEHEPVIVTL